MKVLHVIPSVAARYGGPSLAIFPMCLAVKAAGCEVRICTTNADGKQKLPVETGRMLAYEGIETIFFKPTAGEFKYSRRMARWLDTHVAEFDLIHIHALFNHPSIAAARAARKHGVPYIVRPLGTLDPWCMGQKALKKKLFWRVFGKDIIDGAVAVHYTAAAEQEAVENSLKVGHGVVIPLGTDPNISHRIRYQWVQRLNEYVLFMSRLHPKKGLEVLIEAFASLLKDERFKTWKLLVAGDGEPEYVESIRRLAREFGVDNSIVFTGWLEGEEKSVALHGASLLALPSYQENFGICVMEALSCGVPVMVSPHVNLAPEIEKAGAGWIVPVEKNAIAACLGEAFFSAADRNKRGRAGRTLSNRFSWPAIGDELHHLYSSLCTHN